jgi:hypothetical protein
MTLRFPGAVGEFAVLFAFRWPCLLDLSPAAVLLLLRCYRIFFLVVSGVRQSVWFLHCGGVKYSCYVIAAPFGSFRDQRLSQSLIIK